MRYIVGIDIGGTNLVVGCVAEDGSSLTGAWLEPTRAEEGTRSATSSGRLIGMARTAIAECQKVPGAEIIGIGVGAPGPLDTKSGIVLLTPNLGWVNLPLRDLIQEGVKLPAALDNDANCAVLGEWWMGAARGTRIAIGITIGTGIGGGIIIDGKLFHGASDCAGEIGHTTIDTEGRRCKCGNYGCLEAYASGPNIARRAIEAIESGYETSLPRYVEGRLELITAQTVYEAAHDGDQPRAPGGERHRQVPRRRHRQPGEHLQSRGGGRLWRRHPRGRPSLHTVAPGSRAPGVQAGGSRVPDRALRADRHGGRVRRGPRSSSITGPARRASPSRLDAEVGIIGSLVWDLIYGRDPLAPPVEEWGGIAYALAGLDAALADDWEIVPLIKVGRDLAPEAARFLQTLTHLAPGGRCVEVPVPNNRVTLRYESTERRCERMAGGVPGWTWAELGPMVRDLDAIYLNFISGFELGLGTAQALRQGFDGPIYADFHSLFLGMQQDGIRVLRPLPDAAAWFGCFDLVQLNEDEMGQLSPDPLSLSAAALAAGVSLLTVTLGPKGAAYVAAPGFDGLGNAEGLRNGGEPPCAVLPAGPHCAHSRRRHSRRRWTRPAAATCSAPRPLPGSWRAIPSRPRSAMPRRWARVTPDSAAQAVWRAISEASW